MSLQHMLEIVDDLKSWQENQMAENNFAEPLVSRQATVTLSTETEPQNKDNGMAIQYMSRNSNRTGIANEINQNYAEPMTPASKCSEDITDRFTKYKDSGEARGSLVALLSALYALQLVVLAFAFEISMVLSESITNARRYEVFYIYLYGVGIGILFYCQVFLLKSSPVSFPNLSHAGKSSTKSEAEQIIQENLSADAALATSKKRKVTHSAPTSASLYLRLGFVVFGVVGMVNYGLELVGCISSGEKGDGCQITQLASKVLACVFIFSQMYFIFQNSKLVIHRFRNIGKFMTMHLCAVNLCMWMRFFVLEEVHGFHELNEYEEHHQPYTGSENVSKVAHYRSHETEHQPHNNSPVMDCSHEPLECYMSGFKPFLLTCIIEYAIIGAAIMFVLWKNVGQKPLQRQRFRKHNFTVDCSSSTLGLFTGLLCVVCTIVTMIIFFIKIQLSDATEAMWIFCVSDSVIYVISISACFIGLFRMRNLAYRPEHRGVVLLLDDILLNIGLVGQMMFCVFTIVAMTELSLITGMIILTAGLRLFQVLLQTVFILVSQRMVAMTPQLQRTKPGRQIVTFLLMINLALFLVNTFETHKASSNSMMADFYGKASWMVIVKSSVPLTIFYRFHSSVCLAEIWKNAFRVKTQ